MASQLTGTPGTLNGYTSYTKVENCPSSGTCVPTYTEVEGAYSLGGTRVDTSVDTEDECLDWCTARTECGAVDFNSGNECYWHNNGDWEDQLRTGGSGVSQFRKTGCDGSPTPSGPSGTGKFTATFTSSSFLGVLINLYESIG